MKSVFNLTTNEDVFNILHLMEVSIKTTIIKILYHFIQSCNYSLKGAIMIVSKGKVHDFHLAAHITSHIV